MLSLISVGLGGKIAQGDFARTQNDLYVNGVKRSWGVQIEVDPERNTEIALWWQIRNNNPGLFLIWKGGFTIYNETGGYPVGKIIKTCDGEYGGTIVLAGVNVGKITTPTTFTIKLWANQSDIATWPPEESWSSWNE